MQRYAKTIRLFIFECFLCIGLHVIYAFYMFDTSVGLKTMFISALFTLVAIFVPILVKNERIAIIISLLIMAVTIETLGMSVRTLAFSSFIFLAISASLSIFMKKEYIIYSYIVALISTIFNVVSFKEYIVDNTGSLFIYLVYVLVYTIVVFNVYYMVSNSNKYMKGMEDKANEAQRANESKMMFLANISHEIRTPMNAICGMTELMAKEELNPIATEYLEGIQNSEKVLLSIVNDILDYSKLESGNFEIIPVSYSVRYVIEEIINMMQIKLSDKDVSLKYEIAKDVPDLLFGDEIRLRQILFNLISNSIKYTEKGYIRINISGEEEGDNFRLRISVTDSGIGIRKDNFEKIFESFQQLDTRKVKNHEGTGLGLAICKELTAQMGGSIRVESTYGVGSKFTFDILQEISPENDIVMNEPSKDKNENKVIIEGGKVLVVDDNNVNLKVAQGLLRTFGLTVETCSSGKECLEILKTNQNYDIIFLDHMMPELDGIETFKLIREQDSDYMKRVPVIALTANVMKGVREMFMEEGFDDYVAKPIDMVWMNAILRKFMPIEKQR